MRYFEGCPGNNSSWPGDQRGSCQLPYNRLTNSLLPPRFGLSVIHQQVAEAQAPGGAEIQYPPTDSTLEGNGGITEPATPTRHGNIPHSIIRQLTSDKHLQGFRTRVAREPT